MALFEDYKAKRDALLGKVQDLKQFEQSDKVVGLVFEIMRTILGNTKGITTDGQWLTETGWKLAGYFAYLEGKANEAWSVFRTDEIASKSVRDGMMLALQNEGATVTSARAEAGRANMDVDIDVVSAELRAKNYASAAKICERTLSFIQTNLKRLDNERNQQNTAERGNKV